MGPVGICAIFKDEARDLLEWIAFHICIGFDHIVLFDNGSTDGGAARVNGSPFKPFVTIINWPERLGQISAYQFFCQKFARFFEWVTFLDISEFVHLIDYDSIEAVLPRYGGASGVRLQWLTFAASGHVRRTSGLVIESYDLRLPGYHERRGRVKLLLRSSDVVDVGDSPQVFQVTGEIFNTRGVVVPPLGVSPPCHDTIVINHYLTKSRKHDLAATVRDDRIKRFVPPVKQALAGEIPPGTFYPPALVGS
jgi:hypothetical protein